MEEAVTPPCCCCCCSSSSSLLLLLPLPGALPLLLFPLLLLDRLPEEEAEEVTDRRLRVREEEEPKPVRSRLGKLRSMTVSPPSPAVAMVDC
jgi:hypothetical protein